MATKKKLSVVPTSKKGPVPLIIEAHPKDYKGYPFITVIVYRKQPMLAIVDNADDETIKAFVLDYCGAEGVNEEQLILTAAEWYQTNRAAFPVSIEFSRRGLVQETSKIYRSLSMEFISRVIGPVPKFPMGSIKQIKRRRRKPIPAGVEVRIETNVLPFDQFFKS